MPLKARWVVRAGIIPHEEMREHTRMWDYTSHDYDDDMKRSPEETVTTYGRMQAEAYAYAQELTDPRRLNWVRCEWMWM